jgi:hypothetical protein
MRARVVALTVASVASVATLAALIGGCTAPTPLARVHDRPLAVPSDLSWQWATSCMLQMTSGETVVSISWGDGGADVQFDAVTPATVLDTQILKACFAQYRTEPRPSGFGYVDAYERSRLWDYYTAVTEPCLRDHDVIVPPVPRSQFFLPDQRPWNPYTSMDDLPFPELLELYQDCPPVPASLSARHERG